MENTANATSNRIEENLRRNLSVGTTLATLKQPAQAATGANDQVVMAFIGVGSQGTSRLKEFMEQPDVRIAAICDVDKRHLDRAIALVE